MAIRERAGTMSDERLHYLGEQIIEMVKQAAGPWEDAVLVCITTASALTEKYGGRDDAEWLRECVAGFEAMERDGAERGTTH